MAHINISDLIPVGKDNAIARKTLCVITGLTDGVLRHEIHKLRRYECIINDQDGKGYYKPETVADAKRFYLQERHRAQSIIDATSGALAYIQDQEGGCGF